MDLTRIIDELRQPAAYPHPADDLEVHQTHISVVFLAGEFAYKIKKPVDLAFVDYSTLERRRHFCREEVRLNRRLAPEVYLGVAPVVERDGGLRVVPDAASEEVPSSTVVEWAVRMERLPAERTLLALLEREAVRSEDLEAVAAYLAEFHGRARRDPEISRYGRFEVVAENLRDNFRQSEDQVGRTVHEQVFRRAGELAESWLQRQRGLIEERAARGVPCDTHGDLRLDHVYFLGGRDVPVIVDCIEFNPGFRYADPVADMAFLAMDLQQAGRRDLAAGFSDAYFRASGDREGRELLDLYVAYRATVRGKVQGIKAAEGEIPARERRAAADTAKGHWLLALGVLAPPVERPGLVLVGGLPGTGKSTLARGLAGQASFHVIRSDTVRKELAGLAPRESAEAAFGSGIYTEEWSDRTYGACLERARRRLFRGERVIVDASFHREERRRAFLEAGRRHGARVLLLICDAAPEIVRGRMAARGEDASDADWSVYRGMTDRWESPCEATARVTATIPTGAEEVGASVRQALEELRAAGLY